MCPAATNNASSQQPRTPEEPSTPSSAMVTRCACATQRTCSLLNHSAAGILLTLCQADRKQKEAVVKAKAGPDSCCQVLHACLACGDCMPRHVVALLASLAASPPVSMIHYDYCSCWISKEVDKFKQQMCSSCTRQSPWQS